MAISLFRNRQGTSQADIDRAADDAAERRAERDRDEENRSDDDRLDRLSRRVNRLADKFEEDEKRARQSASGGLGGFADILQLFQVLNVDGAAQYAVSRATEAAAGPVDAAGTAYGGSTYDPASSGASAQVNGRILKWCVNRTVFLGRALLSFMLYFSVLLKWHVLEMVIGEDNAGSMADIGDLLVFSVLAGGLSGNTGGTMQVGFLSGLFGIGSNAPVQNTTPFYPTE